MMKARTSFNPIDVNSLKTVLGVVDGGAAGNADGKISKGEIDMYVVLQNPLKFALQDTVNDPYSPQDIRTRTQDQLNVLNNDNIMLQRLREEISHGNHAAKIGQNRAVDINKIIGLASRNNPAYLEPQDFQA